MRSAVPVFSAIVLLLISVGVFLGGRLSTPSGHAPDTRAVDAEPVETMPTEVRQPPGVAATDSPPASPAAPSRMIAPGVVAPPQLDPEELQREAPRAPLSELALPLPPKRDGPEGGRLFRPLALESAVVESMGIKVTIAGARSLAPEETCDFEGESWACGIRARTAFRMWLRGRALECDLPPDAGEEVTASCRLGRQDAGAWLVSNGWAHAAPGGPYSDAEAEARAAGRGIFGPPPAPLPAHSGATDEAAATQPADPTGPVE